MNRQREMPDGSRFAGRAAGHKDAFAKAFHSVYPKRGGRSSRGEPVLAEGRVVGRYYPDRQTFVKRVRNCHILKKPPSIAVDKYALLSLSERGCNRVVAELVEQDRTLEADVGAFFTHGVWLDRGFGEQLALPLSRWRDLSEERQQLALLEVDM